jgi:regulatory protein YycH of two-component signal transduction system YycFG
MNYENIKSLILTILVLTSLVLTWNLWTYQPDFDYINNERVISDVEIRDKKNIQDLIQPNRLLYHYEDNLHTGTVEQDKIDRFMREFENWNLFDIIAVDNIRQDFTAFMHGPGKMEVVFPDEIPLQTFRYLTGFTDEIPDISINRMVIDLKNETDKSEPTIYLVNYEEQRVHRAKVNNISLSQIELTYKAARDLQTYLAVDPESDHYIFVPELSAKDSRRMRSLHYLSDQLNPEDFKNALFSDPSIVTRDQVLDGEVYRDESRLMSVSVKNSKLQYVNPGNTGYGNSLDFNVIEKGIDFVNEHSGWTGRQQMEKFKMDRWNRSPVEHTVVYRMHMGNYPIFNFSPDAVSEISQSWRNNEIYEYVRPTFEFNIPLRNDVQEIPSGREAIRELKNMNIDLSSLQDVRVGYELKRDLENDGVFVLEPVWVYQENNSWSKIVFTNNDLRGGM